MDKRIITCATALLLFSGAAHAHPAHGEAGLTSGFLHVFAGVDHLAVMVAIGALAAGQSGAKRWALPILFTLALVLATAGASVGGVSSAAFGELAILGSIVALGAVLAFGWRPALEAAAPIAICFGMLHGYVHGVEVNVASEATFLVGLGVGSFVLTSIGVVLGAVATLRPLVRLGGTSMLFGAVLVVLGLTV